MKVTIHQPEHLPWIGFFSKVHAADVFVIIDTAPFKKNYFQNRNKIKTHNGPEFVTVPVAKMPLYTPIRDVLIGADHKWKKKYLRTLELSYGRSKYFNTYFPTLRSIIERDHTHVSQLNVEIIKQMMEWLGMKTKVILSSELDFKEEIKTGSDHLLQICTLIGADAYLSGPSGRDYLKVDDFKGKNIDVDFYEFTHPTYDQLHGEFCDRLSAIDLLFNCGPELSREILFKNHDR